MWPNTNPAKAYGTMLCVGSDKTVRMTVGKRYTILDMDLKTHSLGETIYDYLVENDAGEYIWMSKDYLTDFVSK